MAKLSITISFFFMFACASDKLTTKDGSKVNSKVKTDRSERTTNTVRDTAPTDKTQTSYDLSDIYKVFDANEIEKLLETFFFGKGKEFLKELKVVDQRKKNTIFEAIKSDLANCTGDLKGYLNYKNKIDLVTATKDLVDVDKGVATVDIKGIQTEIQRISEDFKSTFKNKNSSLKECLVSVESEIEDIGLEKFYQNYSLDISKTFDFSKKIAEAVKLDCNEIPEIVKGCITNKDTLCEIQGFLREGDFTKVEEKVKNSLEEFKIDELHSCAKSQLF